MLQKVLFQKPTTGPWKATSPSVSTFKPIINAEAKVGSSQANYLKRQFFFPGGLSYFGEKKESKRGWKRTGNTNMITTVAQAQVITGVKRSPASPEANELLSPFHLCRGELCHLQIAGETWFTSLQPPTSHATKKHWSISANHRQWCNYYLVMFDMGRPVCVFLYCTNLVAEVQSASGRKLSQIPNSLYLNYVFHLKTFISFPDKDWLKSLRLSPS